MSGDTRENLKYAAVGIAILAAIPAGLWAFIWFLYWYFEKMPWPPIR